MVLTALSLEFVGVLPTLAATTILLALAWGERRPWMLIPYALTLPMFFFWFFSKGLNIYFEPGHLFIGR